MIAAVRTLVRSVFTSSHTRSQNRPHPLLTVTRSPKHRMIRHVLETSGLLTRPCFSSRERRCVSQGPVCLMVLSALCLTAVVSKLREVSVVCPQFSTLISCTPAFIICDLMYTLISCLLISCLLAYGWPIQSHIYWDLYSVCAIFPGFCVPKAQYSQDCIFP